jgi:hypothetical protein
MTYDRNQTLGAARAMREVVEGRIATLNFELDYLKALLATLIPVAEQKPDAGPSFKPIAAEGRNTLKTAMERVDAQDEATV